MARDNKEEERKEEKIVLTGSSDLGNGGTRPRLKGERPSRVRAYLKDYCQHSSMHGFQYIGEEERPLRERGRVKEQPAQKTSFWRLWWAIAVILGVCICIFLLVELFEKRKTSPIVVYFDERQASISDIPYPAVTICTRHPHIDKAKFDVEEVTRRYPNVTEKERRILMILERIGTCEKKTSPLKTGKFPISEDIILDDMNLLQEVLVGCNDIINKCTIGKDNCTGGFHPNLMNGMCCSFNMLSPLDSYTNKSYKYPTEEQSKLWPRASGWDVEQGYTKRNDIKSPTYPVHKHETGDEGTLQFHVVKKKEFQQSDCRVDSRFLVRIHSPVDVSTDTDNIYLLGFNSYFAFRMKPSATNAEDRIRDYSPKVRHCYFPNERRLYIYKHYTQKNCENECIANATEKAYRCVGPYMQGGKNLSMCNSKTAWTSLQAEEFLSECNCLPSCMDVKYEFQLQQINFPPVEDEDDDQEALIQIFFMEKYFIPKIRKELYSTTDFIAGCGGLVGLCLGFSALSLVEIIYFFTLRLIRF